MDTSCWLAGQLWLVGFNYLPADCVNFVQMWQADTFDEKAIDREFALAESVGFNCLRNFLPYNVWEADPEGFRRRMDRFLALAAKHGLRVMPVLFDDCAFGQFPEPFLGRQPEVVPGYFFNGWVPSPGARMVNDRSQWPKLRAYVQDLLRHFSGDKRVLAWDLYNEPAATTLDLITNVFAWAREAAPSQPLLAGPCNPGTAELNAAIWERSDVCGFHCYGQPQNVRDWVALMKPYGKPMICTEWLNRQPACGSTPEVILPVLAENHIGAIHWGLVNGDSQCHLWWGAKPGNPEPEVWQHDIFRRDHTPYRPEEIEVFRRFAARGEP